MAEAPGFEPGMEVNPNRISRPSIAIRDRPGQLVTPTPWDTVAAGGGVQSGRGRSTHWSARRLALVIESGRAGTAVANDAAR